MPATFIPVDGRLTSLQVLNTPLIGNEVMEIVSPGDPANGNNYQVTIQTLANFFAAVAPGDYTLILNGATIGSPYAIATTDTRILFNKTIASVSYATAPLASTMLLSSGILIKDLKGDANVNNITVTFTGGELCDGLSSIVIDTAYGWTTINPVPGGGAWYQS